MYSLVLPNSISYIIGSNCQNCLEISFGSDRVVLALLKGYTLIWCRLRLGGDQQALFFAPPNMFNRLGIFFTAVWQNMAKIFGFQSKSLQKKVYWPLTYRVSQKYLDDFLKMGVASKWVKPCLQNFLYFLSILIANFSEILVAIASIFPLYMALMCHSIGGHK